MKFSIEALAANGGFVSRQAVTKDIKWKHDGQEFTAKVNVLPLSYVTAKSDIIARQINGDLIAGRFACCIVDDEGAPVFSVADITGEADPERGPLNAPLTDALLRVIGEVTTEGKPPASSQTKMKSGTSSSSTASAGTRSRKRKAPSATQSS